MRTLDLKLGSHGWSREITLAAALVALFLVTGSAKPAFVSPPNLSDILTNSSHLAIAAAGMTVLIIAGGIDVSVGSMLAICAVLAATLGARGYPAGGCWLAGIAAGALFGALNGALVTVARVPALLATLAMLGVLRGSMLLLTGGYWVRGLPDSFRSLSEVTALGLPAPVWLMLSTVVILSVLLSMTVCGRAFYAVGAARRAAVLAGIAADKVVLGAFVLCGTLTGLSAVVFATRFSVVQSNAGQGFELQVISAAVVGGTDIFGGRGTIAGTLLGAVFLSSLSSALTFLRVSAYWEPAVQGALILAALLADSLRRRE